MIGHWTFPCAALIPSILFGFGFPVDLDRPGRVTVAIEDMQGRRVRNLVADEPMPKGRNAVEWDGRDDAGAPCPVGRYRWRGLVHDEISAAYLGSFYSPGSTPWMRWTRSPKAAGTGKLGPKGAGGWLSDHEAPLCLYPSRDSMFVGAKTAEIGDSIIECGLDGEKRWGMRWLGLSGASAICEEDGMLYVAGEGGWLRGRFAIHRYDIARDKFAPPPKRPRSAADRTAFASGSSDDFSGIAGMYLTERHVAVALADRNRLAFFDRETGAFDHEEPMANANALVLKPSAKIMRGVAADADGFLYRAITNANEQCVHVFAPDGTFVRRIGRRGGRREGAYDPQAMENPVDVALDANGLVWVCEYSKRPKRVSVWTREGALVREYVGGPGYGGGGSLDGRDAYYNAMRFRFDGAFSNAVPQAIVFRPEEHPGFPAQPGSEAVRFRGRPFLVRDDGYGVKAASILELRGDHAGPRVAFGSVVVTNEVATARNKKAGRKKPVVTEETGMFLWQNGGRVVREDLRHGAQWGVRLGPNLEIAARSADYASIVVFEPIPGDGAPQYDFAHGGECTPLPRDMCGKRDKIVSLAWTPDAHAFIVNAAVSRQGSESNILCAVSRGDGRILWSYPNPYPSNTHNSTSPGRGEIRHTLGVEGFAKTSGGEWLFLLNGNKGTRYLFTADGLFVQELFGDIRRGHGRTQDFTSADRGMDLAAKSLGGECFGGWMGNVDGRVFVIEGKDSCNVCELTKLASIKMLAGGTFILDQEAQPLDKAPPEEMPPLRAIAVGGFGLKDDGWKVGETRMAGLDREGDPKVTFAVASHRDLEWGFDRGLRIRVDVEDPTPFVNAGRDAATLFDTGDAIDIRWEGDPAANPRRTAPARGDMRFVVAPLAGGEIAVVRHTFVDPASGTPPMEFSSPVGVAKVARVEVVKEATAKVLRRKGGYALEVTLPWRKVLGEKDPPAPGTVRRCDIGVIWGDGSGERAMRRAYHFDRGSQIVDDLYSEARVNPSQWGRVVF